MKRPVLFYFVAVWFGLSLVIQTNTLLRPAIAYKEAGETLPVIWQFAPLFVIPFMVWQMIGFIQLKPFNRWLAVILFVCWAIVLFWNASIALQRPTVKLVPATAVFAVLIALHILSAWYLSRRSFRDFAVQFVAERAKIKYSRSMQKASQKKILRDIHGS